jgi:hypothetical protein
MDVSGRQEQDAESILLIADGMELGVAGRLANANSPFIAFYDKRLFLHLLLG